MSSYQNAPATAGPSRIRTALTFWKKSDTTPTPLKAVEEVDRIETPLPNGSLPAHPPATYAAYHERRNAPTTLDDFFGAGALEAHRPLSRATVSAPPPYAPYGHDVIEMRPGVYSIAEPPTLARMLFIYGFLFFPFWLAGICILVSPLLPTPDWESGKTEVEKAELLHLLRQTEKKWARRCVYAMFGLTATVLLLVVIIKYGIMANI